MRNFILTVLLFTSISLFSQVRGEKYFVEEINWTIDIPKGFEKVSLDDWAKTQQKGIDAVEKTYNAEGELEHVLEGVKTLFVVRNGKGNSIELNIQNYDGDPGVDYAELHKEVGNIMYETMKSQLNGVTIDNKYGREDIGGKEFYKQTMLINLPNGMKLNMLSYKRLFGKKDCTINIIYIDEVIGQDIIDAIQKSTFK